MAEKNGYRRMGVEALTARKSDVMARQAAAEKHISDQLNTFTLGGSEAATAESITTISNPIHIQDSNFSQLETMNTINEALFRTDGGPIPDTQKVVVVTSDTSEAYVDFLVPLPGEVWLLQSAHLSRIGASGSSVTSFFFYDGTTRAQWFYLSGSSNDIILTSDDNWPTHPLYVSNSCYLLFQGTNGTTMGTMQIEAVFVRVR